MEADQYKKDKSRIVKAARKAVADKREWLETVSQKGAVSQLREKGIKVVKLG